MPRVPTYDEPQVAERALPSARQESVASPALFASQGEAFTAAGKGLQAAGVDLAAVAGRIQDRDNIDRVFQAETVFGDDLIKFETEQRSKKGAAALADGGVTQLTQKFFDDNVRKRSETLGNDAQRRTFGQIAEKMRLQTLRTVSTHEANEARVSVTESAKASIVGSVNRAAANANDWTVAEAEAKNIRTHIAALAKVNGYDQAQTDAAVGEHLTTLHKQMIQQLVRDNPAAALTYFKKYEKEIDGDQRAEIGAFADKATATGVGDAAANAVWQELRPKSRNEPVALDTMEEKVRAQLKGNDDATEKAIKGLRERVSAYRDQRKEESNALEAGVNNLLIGGISTNALRKSPEFLKLSTQDPEAARKILTFKENQDYTAVARANAAEGLAYTRERRAEERKHTSSLDTTLRLMDPAVLAGIKDRNEIVNLLPVLGATSVQGLLQRYDTLTKSEDKLREAKIDHQDFNTIALTAGFRPNEPKKSEPEKDALVRLQAQVETAIDIEQRTKKRELTRDEKRGVMQREIDNAVLTPKFFGMGNDRRAVAVLTPDEQKVAYVLAGPNKEKVPLADIPLTFRLQATKSRAGQGLPTTEQQLAELWLLRGGGKKNKDGLR
jgi:hypothetical protein